jgi:hypothetical protein
MAPEIEANISQQATIEILDEDGAVVEVRISTPRGPLTFIANVRLDGNVLILYDFHIDGPGPHSLGIGFLRRMADQVIAENGVDALEIQGFTRTTGAGRGRVPRPFRFARR